MVCTHHAPKTGRPPADGLTKGIIGAPGHKLSIIKEAEEKEEERLRRSLNGSHIERPGLPPHAKLDIELTLRMNWL